MAGLLDALFAQGGLFSGLLPQQQQAAAASPPGVPPSLAPQDPNLGDRLGAAFQNFTHSPTLVGGIGNAATGLTTGQRTDSTGMMQQIIGATYKGLIANGVPHEKAMLAAINPEVQKQVISDMFPRYTAHNVGNTAGSFNPNSGQFQPQYVAPEFKTVSPGDQGISYQPPVMGGAAPQGAPPPGAMPPGGPMGGVPRPSPIASSPLAPPPGAQGPMPMPQSAPPQAGGTHTLVPGMSLQDKEAAIAAGKAQGETAATIPQAQAKAEQALKLVDQIRNHPGRRGAFAPTETFGKFPAIPGSPGYDFITMLDQAKAGTFLQAYQTLRGGGQISNTEGDKAQNAIARLDRAQSREAFDAALNDFRDVIQTGYKNSVRISKGDMQPYPLDVPKGEQTAAPQFREGQTATNPKTNQRIIYRQGAWQPM